MNYHRDNHQDESPDQAACENRTAQGRIEDDLAATGFLRRIWFTYLLEAPSRDRRHGSGRNRSHCHRLRFAAMKFPSAGTTRRLDTGRPRKMRYLHTMLRVRNLDAALKFYRDALGLKEVRRVDNDKGKFTLVFLCAPE